MITEKTSLKKLIDSDYKTLYFDGEQHLSITIWHNESEKMSMDEYKKDALITFEMMVKLGVKKIISNTYNSRVNVSNDTDLWYKDNFIKPLVTNGLEKIAIVHDHRLLPQIYMESVIDKISENAPFEYRFFETMEEAYNWIK